MFVEHEGQRVEITTSIGIYLFDGSESSYDVALHRADNAQYLAKQAGKNRYLMRGAKIAPLGA
jgi:GGDEF domain-containing protein